MLPFLSRRAFVLAGLAISGWAPPVFAAEMSAKVFVENIYRAYVSKAGKGGNGVSTATDAAVRRYFSPPVAALVVADARQAKKRDDVPCSMVTLRRAPGLGHHCRRRRDERQRDDRQGSVTLTNEGKPEKISRSLVKTPNGWRIDDVIWTEGSPRGLYKKP